MIFSMSAGWQLNEADQSQEQLRHEHCPLWSREEVCERPEADTIVCEKQTRVRADFRTGAFNRLSIQSDSLRAQRSQPDHRLFIEGRVQQKIHYRRSLVPLHETLAEVSREVVVSG
jgi:hypothetical protein